jgi:hypothetical protein
LKSSRFSAKWFAKIDRGVPTIGRKNSKKGHHMSDQDDRDNRADQLNPNNDAYWDSRGLDGRPDDWEDQLSQ